MLEHLSPKFRMPPVEREPRAALILNRFTRPLSIMFATDAVSQILGLRPDQIQHKSFYECIANNCLADAVRCLESAKSNDSIAYLRFWFRDPRTEADFEAEAGDAMAGIDGRDSPSSSDLDSDGGAQLSSPMDVDNDVVVKTEPMSPEPTKIQAESANQGAVSSSSYTTSSSDGPEQPRQQSPHEPNGPNGNGRRQDPVEPLELEAVVSCTSDGLVVILRKARPPIPNIYSPSASLSSQNGLFAAPWGEQPIQPYYPPELYHHFRPPLLPQHMPLQEHVKAAGGPPIDYLMRSIRDVAVFAWALCGINGNLASYCHGTPQGEAQPPNGLPVWDPHAGQTSYLGPENQARYRWLQSAPGDHKGKGVAASGQPYVPGLSAAPLSNYGSVHTGTGHSNQQYPYTPWSQGAAYTNMRHPQPSYQQAGYPPQFPPRYGVRPDQDQWTEAAGPTLPQQAHENSPVPVTQAPNPGEEPHNFRQPWQ
jgi:hypothetical protein